MTTVSFDYVIVGGGAAGCVLASRLSERSGISVLLLEAGQDMPPGTEPPDVLDIYPASYYNKRYMWPGLRAHWRTRATPATGFSQGRLIGGGGSVMSMAASRGAPEDYDEWESLGATGWGWQAVLPYFRKLETDLDFDGELHGSSGPIPIRRIEREHWPPLSRAIDEYAIANRIPYIPDMNADFRNGYCAVPLSNTRERRASSALCYLDAAVRRRSNLTIIGHAMVTGLELEGRRAVGVSATVDGEETVFRAREIIVSCGAILSPVLLMRSGIGPEDALRDLGIEVLADLPGVGANLQNHPLLFVGAHLRRHGRQSDTLRTHPTTCFRYASGHYGSGDIYINIQSKTSWNALGQQIGNLAPTLLKPFSRGQVSLTSADPERAPLIEFNFLDDERDLSRFMDAFARVVDILSFGPVRSLCGTPFPIRFTDRLRRMNELNTANARKAKVIAKLLDLAPVLSDVVLATLTGGRADLRALAQDRDQLAALIRENVAGKFHPAGTCRMGAASDRHAVVDPDGRVHGIEGLRVADASIMPTLIRGNTNIPTIMIAEKIAATVANTPASLSVPRRQSDQDAGAGG